jgi:hypothetical protein
MSYSRWPVYIWGDGYRTHFWARAGEDAEKAGARPIESWCLDEDWSGGLSLDDRLLDQFVACRFAEIIEEGRLPATLRRIKSRKGPFRGNFGAYRILEDMGVDPMAEFHARMKGVNLGKKHAWTVRCPVCKVKKGERCVTANGNPRRKPHEARVDRREAAIEAGIARMRARVLPTNGDE